MTRTPILAALLALALALPAIACNVPVFRYALERWNPDAYEVHIFRKGPLTVEQRKLVDAMQAQIVGQDRQLDSFYINEVDIDSPMDDRSRAAHNAVKPAVDGEAGAAQYPLVYVQFPRSQPTDPPAYAGPLTAELAANLADSPARREIAKRILAGDSVVWLLLESGDRAKDDAAAALLGKELKRLAGELELPELDETDAPFHDPDAGPKLGVAFSVLRLSREAKGEAMFIALLENWDKTLIDRAEPMAFAVFGRGRVMPPLKGKHLTPAFIEDASTFLVGKCSCQVKEENPGWDMLMPVNWDAVMKGQATLTEAMPKLTTVEAVTQQNEAIAAAAETALTLPVSFIREETPTPTPPLLRNLLLLGGAMLGLTLAGTLWLRRR